MFLVLLAYLLQAWAIPISTGPQTLPTLAHTIIWGIEPRSDGSGLADRTMLTIVRSCLLTIAACVYRAIHQNIPDPKASWWERQRIRLKITLCAVLAPETVIWWAMRQWLGAKEVAKQVNALELGLDWTPTHGHFSQMGGFGRLDDGRVLYPPTLVSLLENGQIDLDELRRATKTRIEDQSKGDILSKGVVALQTAWFVFECLARLHQKLPLIELEVVTLAFAVLNTLTYLFWWDKPLNVLCPIYLHILPAPVPQIDADTSPSSARSSLSESRLTEQKVVSPNTGEEQCLIRENNSERQDSEKEDDPGWLTAIIRALLTTCLSLWGQLAWLVHSLRKLTPTIVKGVRATLQVVKTDIKENGWIQIGQKWLLEKPYNAVAGPVLELFGDSEVDEEATHVSMFYGMKTSDRKQVIIALLAILIGMIFGAIHFLSWHSSFPTHTQLILWRTSSVILVAQPLALLFEGILWAVMNPDNKDAPVWSIISSLHTALGLTAYISARFCVLVLAFLTTHTKPPPGALQTISWTSYIPHL